MNICAPSLREKRPFRCASPCIAMVICTVLADSADERLLVAWTSEMEICRTHCPYAATVCTALYCTHLIHLTRTAGKTKRLSLSWPGKLAHGLSKPHPTNFCLRILVASSPRVSLTCTYNESLPSRRLFCLLHQALKDLVRQLK